ncbi:tellurite resistance TerB family protein [Hoeflea sp. YIM 152468]|uniref:tellurite resistance TerB family protein n=1 Tax=Hoeflea sp. YIM 152468 TaxID=3031759 RepID=UPI0023D9A57E|nr:tellurite resistance TerB family protein [Hoeflea sp. YIM 152468]MDF1609215.1 tellurite resistance TerB family protein [Hoeflea sp. YIM 152468]
MFDPKALLDQFLGSNIPGTEGTVRDKANQATQLAKQNPIATGALAAVLLGTGAGRALGGSALRLGGMAAIAGLGYQAWKNYQAGNSASGEGATQDTEVLPPPADSEFSVEPDAIQTDFMLSLIRVMIAAARADGHVDDAERARIHDKLALSGLGSDAIAFLEQELSKPVDMDGIVAAASNEAEKVEMFTAARLAIEPDSRAERGFLDLLAGRLGLPDPLVDHIEATVAAAKV